MILVVFAIKLCYPIKYLLFNRKLDCILHFMINVSIYDLLITYLYTFIHFQIQYHIFKVMYHIFHLFYQ